MTLRLAQKGAPIPPPRGPLMSAEQIATEFFGWVRGGDNRDKRSPKWILANTPNKLVLGHSTVRWYRSDIEAWIASKRESAA